MAFCAAFNYTGAVKFTYSYDLLMIEANTIVLKDLHLEIVVVIIVAVLIPNVFGTVKDLIFVRQVVRDQAIEDDDEVDAEFTPIKEINQQSTYLKVSMILTIPS